MSEMAERVARALFLWQHGHDRWDEAEPEVREDVREAARATLEALREPTEAMVAAGREQTCEHGDMQCGADESWRAMIDEALK